MFHADKVRCARRAHKFGSFHKLGRMEAGSAATFQSYRPVAPAVGIYIRLSKVFFTASVYGRHTHRWNLYKAIHGIIYVICIRLSMVLFTV